MKKRTALAPQRRHGKLRVAALLEAGAAVISERGFQAATMAEIAAKAGAPIGSLYRFFPNKEILADALVQRFIDSIEESFDEINGRVKLMPISVLAETLLGLMLHLYGERLAIRALLDAHAGWSAKRSEFRAFIRRRIAETLILRCPKLKPQIAANMAVIILQNMKTVGMLHQELKDEALSGALAELRDMTRLYLTEKLRVSSS